jgi:hypothetical protein
MSHRSGYIAGIALILAIGAISVIAMAWLNPRMTRYVESDAFRVEMEKETAKGLHFPTGDYEAIKRTGGWTAHSNGFHATDGWKAMRSLDAHDITAKFNPLGVFLRRWQLDDAHIRSAQVSIQVYDPQPESSPSKSFLAKYILPERVYLKHVESDTADVTWSFRGERAGIFATRLLITPHGRDFEYQAREGQLRVNPVPPMRVDHIHLLITKELLTLYNMDVGPPAPAGGRIHAEGRAGTRSDNRSVDFRFAIERVPIADLVPGDWRDHISGLVTSKIHWTGTDTKLEHAGGEGEFSLEDGRIHDLPFLERIATLANDKSLQRIDLDQCRLEAEWHYPAVEIKRLALEEKGKFRVDGELAVAQASLRGKIDLGIAPSLLAFLTEPVVQEVFPREKDGYRWTTVHLSGTLEKPEVDLSPRIVEAIKQHPPAMLKLFFRQIGESLSHAFDQ